jgi:EF-hand domain pair
LKAEKDMIKKLFLTIVTVALAGFVANAPIFSQTSGTEGDTSSSRPPKVRRRVTVKLPDEYRSKDTDKDGQIGMYEWPRADYAAFRKLDLNGDGFLTAQELQRKGSSKRYSARPATSTPAAEKPETESGSTVVASKTQKPDGDSETPASTDEVAPTASRSEAERQFDLVDKDKNGKITEEEFKGSIVTRLKFTSAGVALTFPVGRDEFLRMYPTPGK